MVDVSPHTGYARNNSYSIYSFEISHFRFSVVVSDGCLQFAFGNSFANVICSFNYFCSKPDHSKVQQIVAWLQLFFRLIVLIFTYCKYLIISLSAKWKNDIELNNKYQLSLAEEGNSACDEDNNLTQKSSSISHPLDYSHIFNCLICLFQFVFVLLELFGIFVFKF